MRRIIQLVAATVLGSSFGLIAAAENNPAAVVLETFDQPNAKIQLKNGATVIADKAHGGLLHLPGDASAVLPLEDAISAREGTITFWVRPQWANDDRRSHVLLTARWNDGKQGYLAISYGWWEPLGINRLYFIVNNQQSLHCSSPHRFLRGTWVMVTARWTSGKNGDCALYVNDVKVAGHSAPLNGRDETSHELYIGSDDGATDRRQRIADFQLDRLRIYRTALSERAIRSMYQSAEALRYTAGRKDWAWMGDTLKLPASERRAEDGTLLESRVIFDEDLHWAYSKESADKILSRVKAAGFNVYVPCVWHGRGTHYPSPVTKPDERLQAAIDGGYDPLAYLIEKAHELGIEIHPWFTVMRREWDKHPEYYPDGTPEGAYDVHSQEFRDFIVKLMLDVAERYEVDGINLDYIRAMGICTSTPCKDNYKKNTGNDLQADYYLRFVAGTARNRIEAWQDEAVTDIVTRVANGARKIRPTIVISVDGHPKAKNEVRPLEGRDEMAWANTGLVDVIFAMDYRKRFDEAALDVVYADLADPRKLYPLLGNYDRIDNKAVPRSGDLINKYVEYVRQKWPENGSAFYIFNMLSDDQTDVLQKRSYAIQAKPNWPKTRIDEQVTLKAEQAP